MSDRKTGLEKGTILDDFGNVVKLPDGAVERDPVTGALRVYQPLDSSRIIERNAGCWNCLHYQTGLVYDMMVGKAYKRDLAVLQTDHRGPEGRLRKTIPLRAAKVRAGQIRAGLIANRGLFGVCTGGGVDMDENPVGEFVAARHLCTKWSGATGASLTRAPGEPLSSPIAEEYAKRGEEVRMMAPSDPDESTVRPAIDPDEAGERSSND